MVHVPILAENVCTTPTTVTEAFRPASAVAIAQDNVVLLVDLVAPVIVVLSHIQIQKLKVHIFSYE